MPALTHQRCFNHATREAAARCPECAQFFCRECITEHDSRVICSACLKKLARVPLTKRPAFAQARLAVTSLSGIFIGWIFFYLIGTTLLKLPATFHEGTLGHLDWTDSK